MFHSLCWAQILSQIHGGGHQTPCQASIDKERVTAKFQELVAGGLDPNEAATQAGQTFFSGVILAGRKILGHMMLLETDKISYTGQFCVSEKMLVQVT